jgi:hypothetical protein
LPSTPLNYKLCHISISDKFWPLNESIQSQRNPSAWILKYCSRRKFVVWACYLGWIKFIGILSDWDMLTERDPLLVKRRGGFCSSESHGTSLFDLFKIYACDFQNILHSRIYEHDPTYFFCEQLILTPCLYSWRILLLQRTSRKRFRFWC